MTHKGYHTPFDVWGLIEHSKRLQLPGDKFRTYYCEKKGNSLEIFLWRATFPPGVRLRVCQGVSSETLAYMLVVLHLGLPQEGWIKVHNS